MPTYDYKCEACGHELEAFHAMSADSLIECPECHEPKLVKLIGPGAAVIIKGTENPCHGGRCGRTKKKAPKKLDRLGEGQHKGKVPPWRDGPLNKDVLKNPDKYIAEGKVG